MSAMIDMGIHRATKDLGMVPPPGATLTTYNGWADYPFESGPLDATLLRMGRVLASAGGAPLGDSVHYFCSNTEGTGNSGMHWIPIAMRVRRTAGPC